MTILLMDKDINYIKKGIRTDCKTLREAFKGLSRYQNPLALRKPEYHFSEAVPTEKKALSYLKGIKTKYSKFYGSPLECFVSYSDDPTDWGGRFGL